MLFKFHSGKVNDKHLKYDWKETGLQWKIHMDRNITHFIILCENNCCGKIFYINQYLKNPGKTVTKLREWMQYRN